MLRKLRTRQHVIEDLSYNFVQKRVLQAFCVFQTYPTRQYSYDAQILTFNELGEVEKGQLYVQVKATDHLKFSEKGNGFILQLDKRDLDLWLDEMFPVIVVLYDAQEDEGYYIEIEEYFRQNRLALQNLKKTKQVFIPKDHILHRQSSKNIKPLKMNSFRSTIRSYKDMEPTYAELADALKAFGYVDKSTTKAFVFENEKFGSLILLPSKQPFEYVAKARFASISQELENFGVVGNMDDLGKMILKKRLAVQENVAVG